MTSVLYYLQCLVCGLFGCDIKQDDEASQNPKGLWMSMDKRCRKIEVVSVVSTSLSCNICNVLPSSSSDSLPGEQVPQCKLASPVPKWPRSVKGGTIGRFWSHQRRQHLASPSTRLVASGVKSVMGCLQHS